MLVYMFNLCEPYYGFLQFFLEILIVKFRIFIGYDLHVKAFF